MCLLLIRQREVIEGDGMEGATLTRIYGKLFLLLIFNISLILPASAFPTVPPSFVCRTFRFVCYRIRMATGRDALVLLFFAIKSINAGLGQMLATCSRCGFEWVLLQLN